MVAPRHLAVKDADPVCWERSLGPLTCTPRSAGRI
jgi:hypothetical protein